MMQRVVGASVALALLSVVAVAVVTTWHSATTAPSPGGAPVTLDGEPIAAAPDGATHADWHNRQLIILRLPTAELSPSTAAIALPVGDGESLVAYDAKSTYRGCTVAWYGDIREGVLMDPCYQGQWDARDMAQPYPGTPAPEPLPVYQLEWRAGSLWAEAL